MLDEARKGLPSEPALGSITLAERLSRLQVAVIDAMLGLVGAGSLLGFVHVAFFSPPSLAVRNLVQICTMLALVALRILRPAWRRGLMLGCLLAFAVQLPGFISHWYTLAPGASPNLTIVLLAAILAALTLRPVIGWLILAEFVVATVLTLWEEPGATWTTPVGLATAAGVWCWVIARWPGQLLALLHARHGEALDGLRAQRRMVATLFHDLANPLQVVIAQGEGVLSGSGAANPALIYTNRMREILAASQRSAPLLALRELRALCDDLAVQFRGPLAKKNIRLDVACPSDTKVACDESQLRDSVLANLLSNAIKFSPTGAEISLVVEEDGAHAVVRVADRGPGLPDSVRAAIAAGRRAPSQSGTVGETGSGYGLLLAREYVVAMGGTLDLLPREGGGLVARITLPRETASTNGS
jgi:signal transduction histidine kinase